jgi:hypothetical protein
LCATKLNNEWKIVSLEDKSLKTLLVFDKISKSTTVKKFGIKSGFYNCWNSNLEPCENSDEIDYIICNSEIPPIEVECSETADFAYEIEAVLDEQIMIPPHFSFLPRTEFCQEAKEEILGNSHKY